MYAPPRRPRLGRAHAKANAIASDERGALLAEIVIAIAVFTLVGTGMLSALQTSLRVTHGFEVSTMAENVLRNQAAYVMQQDYIPPGQDVFYLPVDEAYLGFDPADYGLSVTAKVGGLSLQTYQPGCPYSAGDETSGRSMICIDVTQIGHGVVKSEEIVRIE